MKDIKTLLLSEFIRAHKGDLSVLGEGDQTERWLEIYSEFIRLVGGAKAASAIRQAGTANNRATRITLAEKTIELLKEMAGNNAFSVPLIKSLKTLLPNLQLSYQNKEALLNGLKAAENMLIKERKLLDKEKGDFTERKDIEEDLQIMLSQLRKYQGRQISASTTYTYDFCIDYKLMIEDGKR